MQKMADEYLDDVEGAVKIQSFANKMDMDKLNASSLKAQQKIQAFREKEIDALREKENLTQADIDLAEARYQIMLKEIALEDARNNKTSMKLTRNEQGNWSYQYVADEDDVASKQQDLLSAYGDLYKLADDSYNHSMELAMELYETMKERMIEIANDTTLTEEEKNQKIKEIYDKYTAQMLIASDNAALYMQEAMIASAGVFQTVCTQDETAYEKLNSKQQTLVDELKNKNFEDYDALRTAIIEGYYPDLKATAERVFNDLNINSQTIAAAVIGQWSKDPGSVKAEITKAISEMQKAIQNYEKELDELQKIAGMDFSKIGDYIDQVSQKIDNMGDTTEKMTNNSSQYLDELRKALEAIAEKWNSVINQILEAQKAMQEYINLAAQARAASNANNGGGQGGGTTNPGGSNNGDGNKGGNSGTVDKFGIYAEDGRHNNAFTRVDTAGPGGMTKGEASTTYHSNQRAWSEAGLHDFVFKNLLTGDEIAAYRTGGYTGNWIGDEGQPAIVHKKELILNADDTANFLEAIYTMRDLIIPNQSIVDTLTNALSVTFGTLFSSILPINGNDYITRGSSTEQVFNIEKIEFPNATDVDEIREAIITLPNIASQYINSLNGNLG